MEALRLIAEPVNRRLVIELPPGMDSKRVEVIVLPSQEDIPPSPLVRRKPSAQIAGTMALHDDLIAPACPEEDWNVLR
jgi:hypothetical protein